MLAKMADNRTSAPDTDWKLSAQELQGVQVDPYYGRLVFGYVTDREWLASFARQEDKDIDDPLKHKYGPDSLTMAIRGVEYLRQDIGAYRCTVREDDGHIRWFIFIARNNSERNMRGSRDEKRIQKMMEIFDRTERPQWRKQYL